MFLHSPNKIPNSPNHVPRLPQKSAPILLASPGVQRAGTGGVSNRSLTQLQSMPPLHLRDGETKGEKEKFQLNSNYFYFLGEKEKER
jgi:hypothetical protein